MSIFLQITPRTRKVPWLNKTQRKRLASWSSKPWIKRSLAQSWEYTVLKKPQIWSSWFLYYIKDILMSLIPKSKRRFLSSWVQQCPGWSSPGERRMHGQKLEENSGSALLPTPTTGPPAALSPCPAPCTPPVPKAAPTDWDRHRAHTDVIPRLHNPRARSVIIQSFIILVISPGFILFFVLRLLFLFHLIAKDCIETLQNHRALCHITKQTTFTKNISLHLPLFCLCSIFFNFFLHHKAAATLMEASLISDTVISHTDSGSESAQRIVHCLFPLCTGQTSPAQIEQDT